MRRGLAALLMLAVIAAGAGLIAFRQDVATVAQNLRPSAYSKAAFDEWLMDGDHRASFAEFTGYLDKQGVGEVVPAWQLTRSDSAGRVTCERPQFLIPPRQKWRRIVPVLRLLRDGIEPLVGQVKVQSSYRTTDFNSCIGGADGSKHLGFEALDLIAPEAEDNRALFASLCKFHRERGARYGMGLGAYFDIEREGKNRNGRFHIDVSGYRSWGFSYHKDSSACRSL